MKPKNPKPLIVTYEQIPEKEPMGKLDMAFDLLFKEIIETRKKGVESKSKHKVVHF